MELIALRTLISVGAFEKIPLGGSITLRDLSERTGMQDSLLGYPLRTLFRGSMKLMYSRTFITYGCLYWFSLPE